MKDVNGTEILPGDRVVFYGQYERQGRYGSATRGLKFGKVMRVKTEQMIGHTNETVHVKVEGPVAVKKSWNYSCVRPMNLYVVEKGPLHNEG